MDQIPSRKVIAAYVVEIQSTLGIRQPPACSFVWPLCRGDVVQSGHTIVSHPVTVVFAEFVDGNGDIPHV
jgi:hypothetical protein